MDVCIFFSHFAIIWFCVYFVCLQCPVRSLQDMTSGLVLCCLAVEYVSFSKRFLPELINFLAGTLHLAVQDKTSLGTRTIMFNGTFQASFVLLTNQRKLISEIKTLAESKKDLSLTTHLNTTQLVVDSALMPFDLCLAGYIVVPPFRPSGKCSDLLVVSDSESCKSWSQKSLPLSAAQLLELKNNLDKDHHR